MTSDSGNDLDRPLTGNESGAGGRINTSVKEREYQPQGDLCKLWPQIVNSCSMPILKRVMRKCHVSQPDEKTLRISASESVQVVQLRDEATMKYMRDFAERAAGRPIDIQVVQGGGNNGGSAGASAFPEDILSNINFNIGTEER